MSIATRTRRPGRIILLGDSIFDNGVYVTPGPDVITQLQAALPRGWAATLLAVDGAVTKDVGKQLRRVPADATQLVLSVGGNDALGYTGYFDRKPKSGAEALAWFGEALTAFQADYARLVRHITTTYDVPLTVCTVYEGNMGLTLADTCRAGIAIFNDAIQRVARVYDVPVLELRGIFTVEADYANPIEPSCEGGRKMVAGILHQLGIDAVLPNRTPATARSA